MCCGWVSHQQSLTSASGIPQHPDAPPRSSINASAAGEVTEHFQFLLPFLAAQRPKQFSIL
jgi:hypothetical protein